MGVARIAQSAERRPCKSEVAGSIPAPGSSQERQDPRRRRGLDAPRARGERHQVEVLCALHRHGLTVLTPWMTDHARFDAAVEAFGRLLRVQIKTGQADADRSAIRFSARSTNWYSGGQRDYRGEAELFAVYCPAMDATFLVPVEHVGTTTGCLRLTRARNGQVRRVRDAHPYALSGAARGRLPDGCLSLDPRAR